MAYQCPLCGLRFSYRTMLSYHVREDHRPQRSTAPSRRTPAPAGPPPGPDPRP